MTVRDRTDLAGLFDEIRNEAQPAGNTRSRVANALRDSADSAVNKADTVIQALDYLGLTPGTAPDLIEGQFRYLDPGLELQTGTEGLILLGGRLASTTALLPASPRVGQMLYDTDRHSVYVWTGTVWQLTTRGGYADLVGDIWSAANAAGLSLATCYDSPVLRPHFSSTQDKALDLVWQMPHDWDWTVPASPHLHVTGWGTASGDVVFSGRYLWTHMATAPWTSWASWTTFTTTTTIAAATAPNFPGQIISLGSLTAPVSCQFPSTFLHVRVTREASLSTDTYTSAGPLNLALQGADCHVFQTGLLTAGLYA